MLINEDRAQRLNKSQLTEELSVFGGESIQKLNKTELVTLFLEKIQGNLLLQLNIIKKYPAEFALHPLELEGLLGLTKTERIRWTKESKIPVVYYEAFRKWGQMLEYPMYDYYGAFQILNTGLIDKWRIEHQERVTKNRKASAKAAVMTRKRNQSLVKSFYENEWKAMLKQWYKDDPIIGSTLQLAFWTMWVNRFAKEMQLKERNAVSKALEYREKKELFYQLKGNAIKELMKSPLNKIQFYQPENPNKISNLQFCKGHYDHWVEEREFEYISKWDYFRMNEQAIRNCSSCFFEEDEDYYSLFYLSICSGDTKFSFHTPYHIGIEIFPDPKYLEKVVHEEQEGLFRFGRSLFDEEKIIFTEKSILKYFNESLEKFKFTREQEAVLVTV